MNIYLDLFLTFARVGGLTFGGGYAMLPIVQRGGGKANGCHRKMSWIITPSASACPASLR